MSDLVSLKQVRKFSSERVSSTCSLPLSVPVSLTPFLSLTDSLPQSQPVLFAPFLIPIQSTNFLPHYHPVQLTPFVAPIRYDYLPFSLSPNTNPLCTQINLLNGSFSYTIKEQRSLSLSFRRMK